jgi:AraC-like DNA-binding protein
MSGTPLVNMTIVRPIIMAAVDAGASLPELCREAGIDAALINDRQAQITLEQRYRILTACEKLTGEPHLGLIAGQTISPMILGLAGHLMETSPTMRDAMLGLVRFSATFSSQITFTWEDAVESTSLIVEATPIWEENSPETVRVPVDLIMSSSIFLFKLLGGRMIKPLAVRYRYPSPKDTLMFQHMLRVAPEWKCARNEISFRKSDLDLPVVGHNPELNQHFQQMLEKKLADVTNDQSIADAVYRVILTHYRFMLPGLPEVAAHLNMTARTLQRKLSAEGTSFQRVSDRVRRELSIGLLANQRITVAEVAYKMGYSEPAAFQRAFKQWTGSTPMGYRVAHRDQNREVTA